MDLSGIRHFVSQPDHDFSDPSSCTPLLKQSPTLTGLVSTAIAATHPTITLHCPIQINTKKKVGGIRPWEKWRFNPANIHVFHPLEPVITTCTRILLETKRGKGSGNY
jgi:hypothetical protein